MINNATKFYRKNQQSRDTLIHEKKRAIEICIQRNPAKTSSERQRRSRSKFFDRSSLKLSLTLNRHFVVDFYYAYWYVGKQKHSLTSLLWLVDSRSIELTDFKLINLHSPQPRNSDSEEPNKLCSLNLQNSSKCLWNLRSFCTWIRSTKYTWTKR